MKIKRPGIGLEKLKEFFEKPSSDLKNNSEKVRLRKQAEAVLWYLDQGKIRVYDSESQKVNVWVKRAILSFFRTSDTFPSSAGCFQYLDKLPVKNRTSLKGVRVVPGAIARYGSFVESGCVLMPSYINIGAYVSKGTLVDTWATVGSCASIGANVHLSGGVGIGGVLEPEQAQPVVIEDGSFIGSRAIIVEGVHVKREAVIAAGVVLTGSTKIIDVRGSKPEYLSGVIPERAVVIPGNYSKDFPAGSFGVPCALVIGSRKASTDLKTSLNDALREHKIAV